MTMSTRRLATLCAFAIGLGAGGFAGCQTYDFQPVSPLALKQTTYSDVVVSNSLKPNVMLLVDKSGSMDSPVDPSNPNCALADGGICGYWIEDGVHKDFGKLCDPNACPTRWSALQGAMSTFILDAGNAVRLGLTTFPSNSTCGTGINLPAVPTDPVSLTPPYRASDLRADVVQSELDSVLMDAGLRIRDILYQISSAQDAGSLNGTGGGTPTNSALVEVGSNKTFVDTNRQDFILLLTDGVPNCNPYHAFSGTPGNYSCGNSLMCSDSVGVLDSVCGFPTYELGCLDDSETVTTVANLAANQVQTFVVGFGADTSGGPAAGVLNSMAIAGGQRRLCGADGGDNGLCGTDPCVQDAGAPFTCLHAYYQASNQDQLASVLGAIGHLIIPHPCDYFLSDGPSDPKLLSVLVNGNTVTDTNPQTGEINWTYKLTSLSDGGSQPTLSFKGSVCTLISQATPITPVSVEIRVVQAL